MTEPETVGRKVSFQLIRRLRKNRDWSSYIEDFHAARPGITEDVLAAARNGRVDPYSWLIEALPRQGVVLDLACGSAPMGRATEPPNSNQDRRWMGIDRSTEELQRATAGSGRLVRGDGTRLPYRDGVFAAVVCSMALMLLQPVESGLLEIRRVLSRQGTAVFMVPGSRPLTSRDLRRYGRLMVTLRRVYLAYPNDRQLRRLTSLLDAAGLELVSDERVRFGFVLDNLTASGRFVDSLYLPGVSGDQLSRAARVSARWVGSEIGVPLRRIVVRAK